MKCCYVNCPNKDEIINSNFHPGCENKATGEQPELKLDSEMLCVCGDTASQHVNGCERCFIPECGCKEFEEAEQEADADLANESFMENGKEALMEKGMSEEEAEASVRKQMGLD